MGMHFASAVGRMGEACLAPRPQPSAGRCPGARPFYWIATDAGYDGREAVERERGFGFDAVTGEYGDMFSHGVIDPVKVRRWALQSAAPTTGGLPRSSNAPTPPSV